ncbi:hypothetical protein O9G_005202 [Rozella allomycis CSF55]|uniref:Uncharacterized protein n=1 Tax=Rozella allomycis (strain CSF55) TaxID=988480 RepID=A0A075AWM5_ROZAC|nr:hypothetical protein O9G_005202 [Rozella allomycis CSF55]|eukprot:EPZ34632.1 hypothetical protein O9G_005202 [Rozella allomycis CSF55]
MEDFNIAYSDLTLDHVRPAILRLKVGMRDLVHGMTNEKLVECGFYLNSFTREEIRQKKFVPVVSPFALAVFASSLFLEDKRSLLYQIGCTLYQLTGLLTRTEDDLCGTPFQIAHGLWETLIRLLYQSKQPGESFNLCLTSIYPSFDSKTAFQDFTFVVPGAHFMFELTKKQYKDMDQSQLKPNVIYHFGGSNKGFDLACYPTAGFFNDYRDVAWNIETRFGTEDASTVEAIKEIREKMNLTLEQYNVFLVVVLKRKVAKTFNQESLPENCIVLTTEHLADCYGKSFEDYLLFLKKD